MSNNRSVQVQIIGLNDAKRRLRRAHNELADSAFREVNKQVSDLVVLDARRNINTKSGRLARHTVAAPTKRLARVRSGTKVLAPYAGRVHYEDPDRTGANYVIRSIKRNYKTIRKSYKKSVDKILRRL